MHFQIETSVFKFLQRNVNGTQVTGDLLEVAIQLDYTENFVFQHQLSKLHFTSLLLVHLNTVHIPSVTLHGKQSDFSGENNTFCLFMATSIRSPFICYLLPQGRALALTGQPGGGALSNIILSVRSQNTSFLITPYGDY